MTDNTTCVHGQYHHFEQNGREYVQCIHCGEQANIVPGHHTGHGLTPGQYIEQERKRLQARNHGFYNRGGYIRTCIVWKRKDYDFLDRIGHLFVKPHPWKWSCRKCFYSGAMPTWELAYHQATHHAHNHHGGKR